MSQKNSEDPILIARTEGIIQGLKMAIEICSDQGPAIRLQEYYEKKLKVLRGEIKEEPVCYLCPPETFHPGQSSSGRNKISIPLSR